MKSITKEGEKRTKTGISAENILYLTLIGIIIGLLVLFSFLAQGFCSFNTVMNICRQAASLSLAAIAMTMIMISGGIDLSIGAVIAFSGACGALIMQGVGGNTVLASLLGIIVTFVSSLAFGLLNGFAVGYLKIAPFIVTLATQALARGLTLTVTDSSRVVVDNDIYNAIGQIDIGGVIPLSLIIVIAIYILAILFLNKTVFGRKTYAVGDNEVASYASGINIRFHKMMIYAVASVFIALATMVIVGRARSAQPLAAVGMEFDVIIAVVLGGTSLVGGIGNLKGTVLGVVLSSVIFTGLSMMTLPPFVNYVVKGILILLAVLCNRVFSRQKKIRKAGQEKSQILHKSNIEVEKLIKDNGHTVLELKNISKRFPGVRALDNVSFSVKRGTVHALCGENGAGKSTLMKILSGVYQKDEGEILIDGIPVDIKSPIDSEKIGISVIYQELANIPELNVSQNVNLGKEIPSKLKMLLDEKKMRDKTNQLLGRFRLNMPATRKMDSLTVGQQQMVEIAKAYGSNSWVVVMDEPTSAITESDKENLFDIIRDLKAQNIAIVYISHRMSEIFEIADEITVLRDGQHVVTGPTSEFDENKVIHHMVGRELDNIFAHESEKAGEVRLRVENLCKKEKFEPISFEVRSGEVLGFSGLMGAGRTEIMRCICGLDKADGGSVYLNGNKLNINNPRNAIESGIVMVSEDRRREGIIPHSSVRENISISSLAQISHLGWVDIKQDMAIADEYIRKLEVKTPSIEQKIVNLSGGNQQKVCLAKCINCKPSVIILDEPTRGIDVGGKAEIHKLIDKLTKQGMAVILISSELPEIIGASDRIIVLHEGKMMKEFENDSEITQELLMRSAAGIS